MRHSRESSSPPLGRNFSAPDCSSPHLTSPQTHLMVVAMNGQVELLNRTLALTPVQLASADDFVSHLCPPPPTPSTSPLTLLVSLSSTTIQPQNYNSSSLIFFSRTNSALNEHFINFVLKAIRTFPCWEHEQWMM